MSNWRRFRTFNRVERTAARGSGVLGRAMVLTAVVASSVACAPEVPTPVQAPVVSSFQAIGAPHVEPALVPLRWVVSDPQNDAVTCRLDGDGDGVWDLSLDPCPPAASRNIAAVGPGAHTARLEVSDGANTIVATTAYRVVPATLTEDFDIVINPAGPIDADVLSAFDLAAERWERSIARGLVDVPLTVAAGSCGHGSGAFDGVVDDLLVNLSMHETAPAAALSWACVLGPDSLPRVGYVEVDPVLLANLRVLDNLTEVAIHELGHTLGFGAVGQFYGFVSGGDGPDPRFVGPRAAAESSALGRSSDVPVLSIGGATQPHWESAFLVGEIMATVGRGSALSRMTLASFADLGYAVDLDAADPFEPSLPPSTCVTFSATLVRCW